MRLGGMSARHFTEAKKNKNLLKVVESDNWNLRYSTQHKNTKREIFDSASVRF